MSQYFPHLIWLLRDFSLRFEDDSSSPGSSDDYMERALLPRDDWPQESGKRVIRNLFKQVFPKRNCFTLVRPVNDERLLRNIEDLGFSQLRVEFREELGYLLEMIRSQSQVKRIKGKSLNGPAFCLFLQHVADCLNSDSFPGLSTVNERLCQFERNQVVKKAMETFSGILESVKGEFPMDKDALTEQIEAARLDVLCDMQTQWIKGAEWKLAVKEFQKKADPVERELSDENFEVSREFNTALIAEIVGKFREAVQAISREVEGIEPQVEDLEVMHEEDEDIDQIMRQSRQSLVGLKHARMQRSFSRKGSLRARLVNLH